MITHARWGQWETNSSSIHQLIFHKIDGEDAHRLLMERIDRDTNFIVRRTDVSLHTYSDTEIVKLSTPQEKIDFVTMCILCPGEEYTSYPTVAYRILEFVDMLLCAGLKLTVDKKSFIDDSTFASIGDELSLAIVEAIDHDPGKILTFIFDPDSHVRGVHNSHRYEDDGFILSDEDPNYKDFEIITDDY